jgi:hypothetical protein
LIFAFGAYGADPRISRDVLRDQSAALRILHDHAERRDHLARGVA